MKRVQLTKNLFLDEYIPSALYRKLEAKPHIMIGLLDRRLVESDQKLRDKYGPVTINNWWNGGDRNWSGIRTPDSPYYSQTSQHSWGRASDKIFRDVPAEEVRKHIKADWAQLGITCIEENVTWVHSDVRWHQLGNLLLVYP